MSSRSTTGRAALALVAASFGACLATEHPAPLLLPQPDASAPDAGAPDAAAPADAGEDGPDGAIRVASFNTHLFFDDVCESGACGQGDFEVQWTEAGFQARADQIAAGVRSLAPTAVLLQEVENQRALDLLAARLSDVLPVAVLGERGYPASVDVAVLARGDLLEVRRHASEPLTRPDGSTTYFARELLEVHLSIGGARVILFAAHLRSKNDDDPGRRLAEAQAAARIALASGVEFPQALVVLGGDLNDVPGSSTLEALTGSGELLRVAQDLPPEQQVTYPGYGGQALDHLLFDTRAGGSPVPGSVRVICDTPRGFAGSDHCAIRADFAL